MTYPQSTIDKVIDLLAQGLAIIDIEEIEGMPDRSTISNWEAKGDDNSARIARARLDGIDARVEKAVRKAQAAPDAALGRLAFDADRWYASKVSPKYRDKVDHTVMARTVSESIPPDATPEQAADAYRRLVDG